MREFIYNNLGSMIQYIFFIKRMTEMTYIKEIYADIAAFDGKTVSIAGWVRTIRDSKAFGFIELNDGSCFPGCFVSVELYDDDGHSFNCDGEYSVMLWKSQQIIIISQSIVFGLVIGMR